MATANPRQIIDRFGELYTFYTDGTAVKFVTNLRTTPITAFSQSVADSPIAPLIEDTGRLIVTYINSLGARVSQYSDRDGDNGTWAAL